MLRMPPNDWLGFRASLNCHPRESGDPEPHKTAPAALDSRFRGNDIRRATMEARYG
jgi:hypothetical protein